MLMSPLYKVCVSLPKASGFKPTWKVHRITIPSFIAFHNHLQYGLWPTLKNCWCVVTQSIFLLLGRWVGYSLCHQVKKEKTEEIFIFFFLCVGQVNANQDFFFIWPYSTCEIAKSTRLLLRNTPSLKKKERN